MNLQPPIRDLFNRLEGNAAKQPDKFPTSWKQNSQLVMKQTGVTTPLTPPLHPSSASESELRRETSTKPEPGGLKISSGWFFFFFTLRCRSAAENLCVLGVPREARQSAAESHTSRHTHAGVTFSNDSHTSGCSRASCVGSV